MAIEREVRFYFSLDKKGDFLSILPKHWSYLYSAHEVTIMYDNPNSEFSFYSKKVDGRLRVRHSHQVTELALGKPSRENSASCLITWKRRLAEQKKSIIRREEEIEYSVQSNEASSAVAIFEQVLKCPRISSYERVRHFFGNPSVQVTLDEFPFGLMLEFELKNTEDEAILVRAIKTLGLSMKLASNLSCDDKYHELCKKSNLEPRQDIVFSDEKMPKI